MREVSPIRKVGRLWKSRVFVKAGAWVFLALIFGAILLSLSTTTLWVAAACGAISVFLAYLEVRKSPQEQDVVKLVNEQFQSAQYSTELAFDSNAQGLLAIQRDRVLDALHEELPNFKYPVFWKDLIWASAILLITVFGFWFNASSQSSASSSVGVSDKLSQTMVLPDKDSVFLEKTVVRVYPPKYIGLGTQVFDDLDLSVPEQSGLLWELQFSGEPTAVWLRLNGSDSLVFKPDDGKWKLSRKLRKSELYTIHFKNREGRTISSDYHEVQIVKDEPPVIQIEGIPHFQRLEFRKGISLELGVKMTDDYGLTDGFLTATITKGSGESVKFREQKIPLRKAVSGSSHESKLVLELDEFEMEPGNELYFYGNVFDNRQPESQQSRTETFFFILEDTSEVEFSLQGALGIDLMPDYFRSQLQIILDTEKLIQEKADHTEHEFNSESNALGYDQKQLRLKYGQFIGEEEDSGLELEQNEEFDEPETSGEDVLDEFGHNTDKENERGQWMDRLLARNQNDHDHDQHDHHDHDHDDEQGTDPSQESNPLDAFMHNHEDEETATFYTQTLKSKLRAALSEMWNAELYLRLYRPSESLPYQYKAQKLLKEIRNHARIYVQRIGFDPPPVNEKESRLTGKLKEVNELPFSKEIDWGKKFPDTRKAIVLMNQVTEETEWNSSTKQIIRSAGDELAGLAIEYPGKYLATLNQLRQLLEQSDLTVKDVKQLRAIAKEMERALPDESTLPTSSSRPVDEMTDLFIQNLLKSADR